MQVDPRAAIADRALELVGVPFKLGGRRACAGLDCVGVVAYALADYVASNQVPNDYAFRGEYRDRIAAFFDRAAFLHLENESARPGDILMCEPGARQFHLAVMTSRGVVHAHAGLRRVVLTPLPLAWALTSHWRFVGD